MTKRRADRVIGSWGASLLAFSLCLGMASLGCTNRDRGVGVDVPRYPGSSYSPLGIVELQGASLNSARLETPDLFQTVSPWYEKELGAKGWKLQAKSRDLAIWTDGNMRIAASGSATVIDPKKPAHGVLITNAEFRTILHLFESIPTPPPAAK